MAEKYFDLYICPKCGKISLFDNSCPFCNGNMKLCSEALDNKFLCDIKKNVSDIYNQFFNLNTCDKKLWKKREKDELKSIKSHGKIVWNSSLKKNIEICPNCKIITTYNYVKPSGECAFCKTAKQEIPVCGIDYFYPELKGEGYIANKLNKEIEKLGISMRCEDNITSDYATLINGFIPNLLRMPTQISEASEKLSKLSCSLFPVIKEYYNKDDMLDKLAHIINHYQCTLRGQRFLGQENAVNFLTLILMEIEEKTF